MWNALAAALALLTILPIRCQPVFSARALAFFPFIGVLLGGALWFAQFVLSWLFPPAIVAALITALWAVLTGGLHLDGLSDACDALFTPRTREQRLEILRNVHLGAFGATGLILLLLLKFAALTTTQSGALWLAPIVARWAMVYAAAYPLARREGMAVLFAAGLTRREIFSATLTTFAGAALFGWFGIAAWLVAAIIATLLARLALARLGGLTGDIYGMICESVEVSVLLVGARLW